MKQIHRKYKQDIMHLTNYQGFKYKHKEMSQLIYNKNNPLHRIETEQD